MFFWIQLTIILIYILLYVLNKKDNLVKQTIKAVFDVFFMIIFFIILSEFSITTFMTNQQVIDSFSKLFNLSIETSILNHFYIDQSANVVAPLFDNIARLILFLLVLLVLKPVIFKLLSKKLIPSIEIKVLSLLKKDIFNKFSQKTKHILLINFKISRGFFNAFIILLPIGVLLSTFQPLQFNDKLELELSSNGVTYEIHQINDTEIEKEVNLDSGFIEFINGVNEFNTINIHNWFSFISDPIFDWIFEEKMNDSYTFNIRKEFINTANVMENFYQAGVFDKTFSVKELDAKDVELISNTVLIFSESELVLEVIESSIFVLQNGLLDEITNVNNIDSEYTVKGFENLNKINWNQELIVISKIIGNFENFERFDTLENTLSDPMYLFELNDNDIKLITISIREISTLEIIKSTNIILDYIISSEIPLSILTFLDDENARDYLEAQFKEILSNPNYFYGQEGEINRLVDLFELIFIGNGITKFKEYIDEEFSLDLLLSYKTNLYLNDLLDNLFNIKLVNPIISMAVDNYLFENFESEDAEIILERLELNFNNFSIQNEINTIDDVFRALITINIPGYLDSDQEVIDIIDEIISDHIEDVKDLSFSIFKDSRAVSGLINAITPELIYHFVPDIELATILVETFFVEDQLVIDLAKELELILDAIDEINKLNSITTFTNLEDEEIIPFLENFISNDLVKYKKFSSILLDDSEIISKLLELSPVKTIDFFITDELTRELLKKAFIVDEKINIDIDQEINHLIDNIILLHEIITISELENVLNEGNYIDFVDNLFINHMEELEQVIYEIFERNNIIKFIFEKAPEEFFNLTITDEKVKNYLLDLFEVNEQQVIFSQKIIETIESVSTFYSFSNIQEINDSIQEENFNIYIKEKLTENKEEIVNMLKTFDIISDSKDVEILIDLYTESRSYNQFFISLIEENKETFINVSREVLKSDIIKNSIDNSAESLFELFIPDEELKVLMIGALTSEGNLTFELIDELESLVNLLSDVNELIPLNELLSSNAVNLNNSGQSNLNAITQSIDIDFVLNNREEIENILIQFFELNTVNGMLQEAPEEFFEFISPDEKIESLLKVVFLNEDGEIKINLLDSILDSIDILEEINDLVPFNNFQQNLSFDLINREFQTIENILTRILSNDLLDSLINNATYELIDFIIFDEQLRELLFGIFLDENNQLDIDINNEISELIDIIKFTNEIISLDDLFNDLRRSSEIIPILELLTNDYKTITKMVINRFFSLNIVQKTINIAYDELLEVIVVNENIRMVLSETYAVTLNKSETIKQDILYFVDILEFVDETFGLQFFENALRNNEPTTLEGTLSTLLFDNKATTKFLIRSLFNTHMIREVVDSHLAVLIDELVTDTTINETLKTVFVESSSASTIENDLLEIIDISEFIWSSLNSSQSNSIYLNNYSNLFNQVVYLISIRESSIKTSINALFETNIIKQVLKLDFIDLAIYFGADSEFIDFIDDIFYEDGVLIDVQKNLIELVNVSNYYSEYLIDVIALGDLVVILENFDHISEFVSRLESIQIFNNLLYSDLTFIFNNLEMSEDIKSLVQIFLTNENQLNLILSEEVKNINEIIEISKTIFDFEILLENINDLTMEKLIKLGYSFGSLTQVEFNTLITAFKDLQILDLLNSKNTIYLLNFIGIENVYVPRNFDAGIEVEYLLTFVYTVSTYLNKNLEPESTSEFSELIEDVDFTELLLSDAFADLLLIKENTLNSQLVVTNLAYSIESALIESGLDQTIIVPDVLLASSPESLAWTNEYNSLIEITLSLIEIISTQYMLTFWDLDQLFNLFYEENDVIITNIYEIIYNNMDIIRGLISNDAQKSMIILYTVEFQFYQAFDEYFEIDVFSEVLTLLDVLEDVYGFATLQDVLDLTNGTTDAVSFLDSVFAEPTDAAALRSALNTLLTKSQLIEQVGNNFEDVLPFLIEDADTQKLLLTLLADNNGALALDLAAEVDTLLDIVESTYKFTTLQGLLGATEGLDLRSSANLGYAFGSLTPAEFNALTTALKELQLLELLDNENTESLLTFLGLENVYLPEDFDAALEVEYLFNVVYGLSVYIHENMEPGLTPIEDVDFTELLLSDAFADLLLVKEGTLNSQLLVTNLAYSIESALVEAGLDETIIVPEVLLASSPESAAWAAEYNVLVTLLLTVAELASNYYELSFWGIEDALASTGDELVDTLAFVDDILAPNVGTLKLVVGGIVANSQILVATADHTLNTIVEPILGTEVEINVIQEILTLLDVVEVGYDVFTIEEIYTILNDTDEIYKALVQLGIEFGSLENNRFEELKSILLDLQLIRLINYDTANSLFDYFNISLIIVDEIDFLNEINSAFNLIYLTSEYLYQNYSENQIELEVFDFTDLITSDDFYEIIITDSKTPTLLSINFAYHLSDILNFNELDFLDIPERLTTAEIDSELWTYEYVAWINIIRVLFKELNTEYIFSNQGLSEMVEDIIEYEFSWLDIIENLQDDSGKLLFNSLIDESLIISNR